MRLIWFRNFPSTKSLTSSSQEKMLSHSQQRIVWHFFKRCTNMIWLDPQLQWKLLFFFLCETSKWKQIYSKRNERTAIMLGLLFYLHHFFFKINVRRYYGLFAILAGCVKLKNDLYGMNVSRLYRLFGMMGFGRFCFAIFVCVFFFHERKKRKRNDSQLKSHQR